MQGDHLGSSSLVMTSSGTLNTRQTYFPYGAKRVADGNPLPTGMDTTFTGQKSDDSTGLMFYGARYYDATLGRFVSADTIVPNPLNPQSLNRYGYTLNNPVRYMDPTGHMEVDESGGGGNGIQGDTPLEQQPEIVVPYGDDLLYIPVFTSFCDLHPFANGCGNNQKAQMPTNREKTRVPVAESKSEADKYLNKRLFAQMSNPQTWYDMGVAIDGFDAIVSDGMATIITLSILAGPEAFATTYGLGVLVNTIDIPFSLVGTGATIIGDHLAGETNLLAPPGSSNFKVGGNTINSVASTAASAVISDSFADAIINTYQHTENDNHLLEQVVPFLRPFPSSLFGK